MQAALYMYDRLKELGIPVILTRDDDTTLSRNERINAMKSLGTGADVLVLSNHINAGGGEDIETNTQKEHAINHVLHLQSL